MTKLTLNTFKEDIQHLIIRYNDKNEMTKHVNNLIDEHYSHIKTDCLDYFSAKSRPGPHKTHCCIKHGNKFCPIESGEIEQEYLCEDCSYEGLTELSQLHLDNMNVKRITATGNSCNFCDRGKINDSGNNLVFPYTHVTSISTKGSGISVRMCDDCIRELNEKIVK